MDWFDVRIAFPSGLVRSHLDFLLSFDYPLMVLIPFEVIAKASRASGTLNTLQAREMLTTKTSYVMFFCLNRNVFHVVGACKGPSLNHPHLSFLTYGDKVSRASYSTCIQLLITKHPSRKV